MIKKFFTKLQNIKTKQSNIMSLILCQIYIIILSFGTVFFTLGINKTAEMNIFSWVFQHIPAFLLSFFIVFIFCEILYLLTFYLYVPLFIVYPVIIAFSYINFIKVFFRSETFVFSDLTIIKEAGNIVENYDIKIPSALYFSVIFFVVMIISALFIKRIKIPVIPRVLISVAGTILFSVIFYIIVIPSNSLLDKKYTIATTDLRKEYAENGFILGFITSFKRSLIFAPNDYNKDTVQKSADFLGYDINKTNEELPEELPNIIVIMSESYWDCYNNLTGIAYNKDPMESVRTIMDSHGSGRFLSPLLGGGTSNVEYEFLTGKSIMFYPSHSIIYQQYITKKQWSLAWYFNDLGYSTSAIHPYFHWFWKRSTVYPLLGFENIYFDTDMKYTDKKGNFISDESLINEIIDKYELLSDNGNTPVFNFSISMQNHGGYWAGKYTDPEIKITVGNGDESDMTCELFGEGIRYASEAFVELTEYFKSVERPTYIIMFGDHAPSLANNKYLYALDENTEMYFDDVLNMHIMPVVIWSNTGEYIGNIGTVNPIMMNVELFDITGLPKPPYIQMLSDIKKTTSGFTAMYYLDNNGDLVVDETLKQQIGEIIENLRYCQYDATLGKNYVIDEFGEIDAEDLRD